MSDERDLAHITGDALRSAVVLLSPIPIPIPVQSSWIRGVMFDRYNQQVTTFFGSGGSQTDTCSLPQMVEYLNSVSKGRYFDYHFRRPK